MKIFKACDYEGNCIGIVGAAEQDTAYAFFVGAGEIPHSIREIDLHNAELTKQPLLIILRMKKYQVGRGLDEKHVYVEDRLR